MEWAISTSSNQKTICLFILPNQVQVIRIAYTTADHDDGNAFLSPLVVRSAGAVVVFDGESVGGHTSHDM